MTYKVVLDNDGVFRPVDILHQAPRYLFEDIGRCFAGLGAFLKGRPIRGSEVSYENVLKTYEVLERFYLPTLLSKRHEDNSRKEAIISRYNTLKALCEKKREGVTA